ncbi:hypothetical protein [Streptomyces sp. NPDC003395]
MTAPVQVGPSTVGGPTPSLSPIELAVLDGVAHGLTYMQIAKKTGYAFRGVTDVGVRVVRKLGATDLAHAVFLACRAGILDGRPERHGDHAGFIAHQRRGEDPWACELGCPEGERAYRRERRAARRAADRAWKAAVEEIADAS